MCCIQSLRLTDDKQPAHVWQKEKKKKSLALYYAACVFQQALYENMLVELPFASFFLSKLLGTSADVDIHHLASLDPEMYRNLLFLKSYEGDVEELGLNFTVVNNDLGEAQVSLTAGESVQNISISFFALSTLFLAGVEMHCQSV